MNFLKSIFLWIKIMFLFIILAFLADFYLNIYYPCLNPISYSIGKIDKKFNLNKEEALSLSRKSENIWEQNINFELFQYNENSNLKINFTYDVRQEKLEQSIKDKSKVNDSNIVLKKHKTIYSQKLNEYNHYLKEYNIILTEYEKDLKKYNNSITYLNSKGGAPEETYNKLNEDKEKLKKKYNNLKNKEIILDKLHLNLNNLRTKNNNIVKNHNNYIHSFNKKYGNKVEFDQGNFDGKNINLFYFEKKEDLILLMAHELGHARGFGHVENNKSLMYYLMENQDRSNFKITKEDKTELLKSCNIDDNFYIVKKYYEKIKFFHIFINKIKNKISQINYEINNFSSIY